MSEILERLIRNKDSGEAKSYIVGLERGRVWAEDHADYFEMREWAELEDNGEVVLPAEEDLHLRILMTETTLELSAYMRGWFAGVKEVRDEY